MAAFSFDATGVSDVQSTLSSAAHEVTQAAIAPATCGSLGDVRVSRAEGSVADALGHAVRLLGEELTDFAANVESAKTSYVVRETQISTSFKPPGR